MRHGLVGFQVIGVDLAGDQELVDLDVFVAARKALCASGRSEQHDVLARAEVKKSDLAEDPAALLPTQRPGVGSMRSGYSAASNWVAREMSSPPARGRPTTSLATVASTSGSILYGIVRDDHIRSTGGALAFEQDRMGIDRILVKS